MTLGEKIKFFRTKLNLSQEELANKCNLSRNAIYNYENNRRTPTISTLETIAENLNLSSSDLLGDGDSTNFYSNKLELLKAIDKDIKNIIDVEKEKSDIYQFEMNELYKRHFFDLFNWKTSTMKPHDYFKFILSLCPLNETHHITEEDINELSILFYRFLTLKFHERNSLNENEKILPGNSKKYEKNNFITTTTK
jgi:transcriptional regulator with XRE-family HTH domain